MKFAYKKFELQPGARREFVLKPIIPFYLFHGESFVRLEALIDSGADFTLFHSEIADVLGIRWKTGVPQTFEGITGARGTMYFHQVKIKIGQWNETITCGFSNDLSENNYGILGQEGFFEHFKVSFYLATETIQISKK